MRRPFYDFLVRREDLQPGIIEDDFTNVSRTALVLSLAIGGLSLKYGTELSATTALVTAALSIRADGIIAEASEDLHQDQIRAITHKQDRSVMLRTHKDGAIYEEQLRKRSSANYHEPLSMRHKEPLPVRPLLYDIAGGAFLVALSQTPAAFDALIQRVPERTGVLVAGAGLFIGSLVTMGVTADRSILVLDQARAAGQAENSLSQAQ